MGLKKRGLASTVHNMIKEIRSLQSSDRSRLRDDHKHGNTDDFARFLKPADNDDGAEDAAFIAPKNRPAITSASLIKGDALWSQFFVQLAETPVNDKVGNSSLFTWGENRENAKRHTEVARQSASLQSNAPLHILNEKI